MLFLDKEALEKKKRLSKLKNTIYAHPEIIKIIDAAIFYQEHYQNGFRYLHGMYKKKRQEVDILREEIKRLSK